MVNSGARVALVTEPPAVREPAVPARDAEQTRQRILDAALDEFSAKGISGARVDAIAEQARVNKRMLYYYFGSKDGLFRAVLQARFAEAARDQESPAERPAPADRLPALAERFASSPQYVRLLMWEALERGAEGELEEEEIRRAVYQRWVENLAADQVGRMPAALDPAQLVLAELATTMFASAFPQLVRLVTGSDPAAPSFREAQRAFLAWAGTPCNPGTRDAAT
ncbi:MAG: TetR family transcriptional regulator [Acidimicrobiales bacterium]